MRDDVASHGARFLLVTLSNGVQVYPDPHVRSTFAAKIGTNDLFYPDRRIEDFSCKNGIEALILAPSLFEHAERNRTYLHGFMNSGLGNGHWNELGHRLAGERIAERLCGNGFLREGAPASR
jgi:hypothetical protein